jgi:hypothetical protein
LAHAELSSVSKTTDKSFTDLLIGQPDKEMPDRPTRHIVSIVQKSSPSESEPGENETSTDRSNTRDSLGLCKSWLHRCLHHHQLCNEPRPNFIPTRLVSLLGPFPKLVEPEQSSDVKTYATLSHCWGTSPFLTLTNTNLQEFCQQIPPEALSNTFLDAIFVCKELGIDYIWIDSLCIIQDDAQDWVNEAALMTKVYRNSHLNIAATGASDGTVGLFFDRHTHWHCRVEVSALVNKQIFNCVPFWMYGGSIDYEPLSQRGWAFQESLLPPRTLQFTRTQIFWNCEDAISCEIFPDAFPLGIYIGSGRQEFSVVRKQPIHEFDWRQVVVSYTQRLLTFQEDKLVAISGLAREIQWYSRDSYCAGIWLKDLQFQLCWFTQSRRGAKIPSIDRKVAPSWSWASVPNPITFNVRPIQVFIQGLKFKFPLDEDPFGVVSTAKVVLSSSDMWKGTLCDFETFEAATASRQQGKVLLGQEEHEHLLVDISDADELDISNLWFMPVAICDITDTSPSNPKALNPHRLSLQGLILRPLDIGPGYFHRVGAFQESNYTAATIEECRSMIYKGLLDSSVGRAGDEMYQRCYEDDDGVTRKVITLV